MIYAYADIKGADQPMHPRSLIDAFVIPCLDCMMPLVSTAINKYVLTNEPRHMIYAYANNKSAYQSVHLHSLIDAFVIPSLDCITNLQRMKHVVIS